MAITSMNDLAAAIAASQDLTYQKASVTSVAAFWYSLWTAAGNPPAGASPGNTTNGLVPDDSTTGAMPISAFTGGATGYLGSLGFNNSVVGSAILYDRLWHAGAHTITSAGTVTYSSQPSFSARVPNSNWAECEIWLEFTTTFSATATTLQVNYQDGNNAAQNTTVTASLSGTPAPRMIPLGMANATGVQRINTLVTGGTTATAGAVNVVVLRRLAQINNLQIGVGERQDFFKLGGQTVFDTSCLAMMVMNATGTASGTVFAGI